jgi:SAM-dependent methyltransferase
LLGPLEDEHTGEIRAGALRCQRCERQTAIRDGIWDALGDAPLPHTPAQLTNYLPITARLYEPLWRWQSLSLLTGRRFPLHEELTLLRQLIQPQPGQLYIDVACSAGLYARALAEPGAIVVGIDHAWSFLHEARDRARRAGLRISYIRAAAQRLPFADSVASGAAMGGSLNEIGDQQQALQEIERVLQPDARYFCMSLREAGSLWGRMFQRLLSSGGIVFPSEATARQWLAQARLQRLAQWQWRVVAITLLRSERDATRDPRLHR